MQLNKFRALKDLNLQTELLEAFEWDEQARDNFNVWFCDALNLSSDVQVLLLQIKEHYDDVVFEVIVKIFKSEIDNIQDDKIKQGRIYEA